MPLTIAAQTRSQVLSSAAVARHRDRILHCAVRQPSCIAPVKALLPSGEKLLHCSQSGLLILTCLMGRKEVKMVTSFLGVVGEHHTYEQNIQI